MIRIIKTMKKNGEQKLGKAKKKCCIERGVCSRAYANEIAKSVETIGYQMT